MWGLDSDSAEKEDEESAENKGKSEAAQLECKMEHKANGTDEVQAIVSIATVSDATQSIVCYQDSTIQFIDLVGENIGIFNY